MGAASPLLERSLKKGLPVVARSKNKLIACAIGLLVAALLACGGDDSSGAALAAATITVASVPAQKPYYKKVFIVVLENEDEQSALAQPFLSQLANSGALPSQYNGISHPSEPNYLALTLGSDWGIHDDFRHTINATHLGDLLDAKGYSWRSYAEDYPGHCDLRGQVGNYVRKHEPFLSYADLQASPSQCAHVVNAAALDVDIKDGTVPAFSLYIPNNRNNGHDTGVKFADRWLADKFGALLTDQRFSKDMLFVVVFDEADHGNHVYAILHGDAVRPGSESGVSYNHYSLLRTIEDGLGLGSLGRGDATATPSNACSSRLPNRLPERLSGMSVTMSDGEGDAAALQ